MMNQPIFHRIILLLSFFIGYLVLRSHTILGELVHDDGLFLSGAQSWAKGFMPYRDFWDHKPIGVFIYNALPLFFFPFSVTAVKVFHCIVLSFSALFLYEFCRKYVDKTAALTACVFYMYFTSLRYTVQSGGLTEEGALLFVIVSYWLLQRENGQRWWMFVFAGCSLGMAVQFRQTFLAESAFAFGLIFMNQKGIPQTLQRFSWFVVGILLPEIIISSYFLIYGIWWDYFEAGYLYNFYYIGPARMDVDWASILQRHKELIQHTGIFLLSPFIALCFGYWMDQKIRWMCLFLGITFVGDCIAVSLSGEFYAHYYVQASVTCGIFFALMVQQIMQSLSGVHPYSINPVKLLSILIVIACFYLSYQTGMRCYAAFNQLLVERENPNSPYTFQRDVAHAVNQITEPNDAILLIGRVPNSVYIRSERLAGSRFYHFSPLWKPSLQGAVTDRQKKAFMDDLHNHQPALLLLDLTRLRSDDGLSRVEEYLPESLSYIHENYTKLDELVHDVDLDVLWDWYDIRLQIMVRNENAAEVISRIQKMKIQP